MKHKFGGENTFLYCVAIGLSAAAAAAVGVGIFLSVKLTTANGLCDALKAQSEINESALESELEASRRTASDNGAKLDELKAEYERLTEEYDTLAAEKKLTELDSDEKYEALLEQIAEKEALIKELEDGIEEDETIYSVDMNRQGEILAELNELLENGAPDYIKTETDKEGNVTETVIKPNIGVYYEDIERGYTFSYNADYAFDSASCIKAPFALSILEKASEEVKQLNEIIDSRNEALTEESEKYSLTNLPSGVNRIFDFDKIFTYTEEKYRTGTGKIKDSEEGTEYTYLQLIEYMLKYSDNVGYYEIKSEYGIRYFSSLAYRIKTSVMRKSLSDMSASDAGKVMKAIYEFIESEAEYSDFMYECMTQSAHTVMLCKGTGYKTVAHKYGWDTGAYHDIGIVYDEHPYVIAFMSDMYESGSEYRDTVNGYVQNVVALIDDLHTNFYKKAG